MTAVRWRTALTLIVLFHAGLALHAAWNLSPVWDEIVYPAAGYDLLKTGRIRTSFDHPPLGKALFALPLFLQGHPLNIAPADASDMEPFRYGFTFVHQNRLPARWMIFLPRLMAVLLSCTLALFIALTARRIWGDSAGLLAGALYAFLPPVLARASLALLEMPLALFMTTALLSAVRWKSERKPLYLAIWTLGWAAALLTKVNAVVLLPIILLSDTLSGHRKKGELVRRWIETTLVAAMVLVLCEIVLHALGLSYWTGQLLARTKDLAGSRFPFYFHGIFWNAALFYMAPMAWLIKTPIPFLILSVAGWMSWKRLRPWDETFTLLSCAFLVTGLQMMGVRSIIATGHYFYLFPLLALASSATVTIKALSIQRGVWVLIGSLVLTCLWIQPHHLAYFNLLAGGSSRGYEWLGDSDQDWGQELPALSGWMKRQKLSQILLGYAGAGDPRVYGISYQDVISPALITSVYRGEVFSQWPGRVMLVLGAKVVQTETDALEWLIKNRKPVGQIGYSFLIYDVTEDREAQRWLAQLYRFTRRPREAAALPLAQSAVVSGTP